MNSLETLYFPDTAIISSRQTPLLLLYSKTNLILPVEEVATNSENQTNTFMDSQFCQGHTLHPLNEDKDRFLYLINDIKNRKDDYATQLSHIALASLSEKKSEDDDSRLNIMSSILGRSTPSSKSTGNTEKDIIWQARLVLKIAEYLDREEEEVAQALSFLEESETSVMNKLKGESDEESENLYESLTHIPSKIDRPNTQSVYNRMCAWFRFIQYTPLPHFPVWSTTRQEVADILFENHEIKHQCEPLKILEFELPAHLGEMDTEALARLQQFHSENNNLLLLFKQLLITNTGDDQKDEKRIEFELGWKKVMTDFYPQSTFGRMTAKFYLFNNPLPHSAGLTSAMRLNGPKILGVFPF